MCRLLAPLFLVLLATSSARAQNEPVRLSESEFISRYVRVQPQLRIAAARITAAESDLFRARALRNPTLNLNRQSAGDETENTATVGLWFDLGGRRSRLQSARFRISAARARVARTRQVLLIEARRSYYKAVFARERVSRLTEARKSVDAAFRLLTIRAKAGENAGYDRDRLQLELARYDARLSQAGNRYALARLALARMLNAPAKSFDVTGSLQRSKLPALEAILPEIQLKRPDLRAARALLSAANRQTAAAKAWWIPAFQLSAGVRTLTTSGATNTGYAVGLSVRLPIFNRNQAARRRAKADRRRAVATIAHLGNTIRANVRGAHTTLTANVKRLRKLRSAQLPVARRLIKRAHLSFREGEKRVVELVDAQRTLLDVRLRELDLEYQAKLAELTLERALGGGR